MTVQEAFAGVCVISIHAMFEFGDDDLNRLETALVKMNLFKGYDQQRFIRVFDAVLPYIENDEWEEFFAESVKVLSKDLKETVFVYACDCQMRNGFVLENAKGFLGDLQNELGLSDDFAKMVKYIISVKNRA